MSGRIPPAFIDELLSRIDIVDVIQRFLPLRKSGHEYTACCPFHNEKTPSFYVSPQKQFYHCFGCGAHGTAIGFLMEHENLNFPEAIEQLAESAGIEVPRESSTGDTDASDRTRVLLDSIEAAAELYRRQLRQDQAAIDYLRGRGIRGETARDFGIGWAPAAGDWLVRQLRSRYPVEVLIEAGLAVRRDDGRVSDRFRGRIVFPIRDRRGRTTGFGGRLIAAGEPKYLNSPESAVFHKGQTVYGLFEARRAEPRLQHLVLTEGYMDVIGLAEAGFHQAVACMGTALTAHHVSILFRQVRHLTLCFDGDAAGRRAALRSMEPILPLTGGERQVQLLFLAEGDDPDSLVRREGLDGWLDRLAAAQPLSEALLELLAAQHDLGTAEGRSSLVHAAVHWIARIADPIYRSQWIALVAGKTQTSVEQVAAVVPGPGQDPGASGATGARNPARVDPMASGSGDPGAPASSGVTGSGPTGSLKPLWSALLARILQFPQCDWTDSALRELAHSEGRAAETLRQVLERIDSRPAITPAQLLEGFRDTPVYRRLEELSALHIPEQDNEVLQRVGLDSARQLLREVHRKRVLHLTRHPSRLSAEEISELRRLQSMLSRP